MDKPGGPLFLPGPGRPRVPLSTPPLYPRNLTDPAKPSPRGTLGIVSRARGGSTWTSRTWRDPCRGSRACCRAGPSPLCQGWDGTLAKTAHPQAGRAQEIEESTVETGRRSPRREWLGDSDLAKDQGDLAPPTSHQEGREMVARPLGRGRRAMKWKG